ncbi:hypothetical protein FNF29_02167 [Cafeteria roenbergensis]|uniref:Uncharacterized protein n=1 Tax=Cafeteria roenbergensis TaxID=33653 RepID=A0A5A8CPK9_CAFRO|nr:hypothetical protein FNF29_02167 [Cafeteria roenbergensis]|eukprot:KAA0155025.1 hypothetical protein FNF29_02167 [Cafeteria roenbergensis]
MPCGAGRLSSLWYCCCPKGGRTRNTYSAVTAVGFFVLVAIIVVQQLALINGVKNSLETVLRDQVAVVAMLRKLDRVTLLHAAIVAASDPGLTMAAHAGAKDSTDPWKLSVNWTVAEWTSSQAAASQALVAFGRRHGAEIGFLHDAAGAQRAATHRAALDEMGVSLEHETPLLDAAHDLYARAETGALHFRFGEYDPSGAVSFGAAGGAEAIAPGGGEAPRSLELGQDTKLRQGAVVEAASGWHARAPAAGASMTAILHHAKHLEASRVSRPLLDSAGLRGQTSRLSPQATQTNALASIAMAPVWSPGIRAAGTLDPLDLLPEVDRATLRAAYAATGPGGFFEPFASMAVAQVASIEDAIHQSPFDPTLPAVLSGAAMVTANNAVCARGVPQPRPPPRAGGSAPTPCLVSLPRGFLGAGPAAAGVLSVSRTHSGRLDTLARVSNAFSLGWTAYAHDSGHADALAEDRTAAFPWFLAGAYSTSVLRYNPSGAPGQNTPAWSPGLAAHGSPLDRSTLYPLMPLLDAPAGSWQPAELSNIDQLNASTVPPFLRDVLAPAAMLAPTLSGPLRVVAINQLILAQGLQPVPGIRFSLGNISMSLRALTRLYATESAREYGLSAVELSRVNAEIMVNTSAVDLVQGLKAFKQCSAAAGPVDDAAQRRLHVLCSSPLVDGLPLGIVGYVDALLHSQALTRLANWQIAEAVSSSVLVSDNDAAPVTSSSTVAEDDMSLRRPFIVDNGIALGGVEAVREHDARQRFFRLQKRPDALVATLTADTVQALVRSDPVAAQLKILEVEPSGLTRWAGALAAAARLPEAPVRHYHEDSSSRAITAFAVDQTDWLSSATPLFGATTLDNIATGRQVPAMAVRAMPRALIADLFYSRLLMTVLTSVAVLLLFVAFQRCTAVILVTPIEFVAKATLLAAAGRPSIVPLWRIRTATTRSLGLLGAQAAAEATQSKTARKARQLGGSRPVRARLVPAAAVVGSVQQVVSEAGADGERFKDDEAARAYDVMLELRALGDRLGAPGLVPARVRLWAQVMLQGAREARRETHRRSTAGAHIAKGGGDYAMLLQGASGPAPHAQLRSQRQQPQQHHYQSSMPNGRLVGRMTSGRFDSAENLGTPMSMPGDRSQRTPPGHGGGASSTSPAPPAGGIRGASKRKDPRGLSAQLAAMDNVSGPAHRRGASSSDSGGVSAPHAAAARAGLPRSRGASRVPGGGGTSKSAGAKSASESDHRAAREGAASSAPGDGGGYGSGAKVDPSVGRPREAQSETGGSRRSDATGNGDAEAIPEWVAQPLRAHEVADFLTVQQLVRQAPRVLFRERIESVQARKARRRPDALAASAAGAAAGEALLMGGVAMGPRVVGPMPDKSSPSGRGANRPSLVDRTAVGSDASAGGTPGVMMERASVSSHDPTANRARGRTDIVPEVGGGDGSVSDVEGHFVPVKPFSLFTCIWRDLLLCRFCVRSTQNWSVARKERFRTFLFLGLAAVVVGINAFATTVVLLGVFRSALGQEAAVADAVVASRLDALRHSAAAAAAIPAIRTTASAALCASGGLTTPGPFGALAVCNSSDPDARRDASDWSTKATPAAASLLATLTDVLSFDVVALAGADSRLLACPPDPAWRLAAGVAIKAGAAPPPLTVCGGLDPAELGGGGLAVPAPARGLIHAAVLYGRAVSAPMLLDGKWLAARGVRPRFGRRHLRTPQPKAEHHPIASFSNSTPPEMSGYRGCPEAEATTLALCAAVPVEGLPRGFWVLGTDGPESGVNSTQDARGRPKQEGRRLDEGGSRAATAAAQPGATDGRFYPDPPEWGQLPRGVPPGGAYTSVLDVDEDSAAAGTAWQESPAAVAPSGAGDEHSLPRAWTAGVVLACDVLDGKTTLLEDMVAPLRERSTLLYKLVRRKGRAGGASRGDLFVSGLDHGLLEAEARAAAAAPAAGSDAAAAGWARVVPPVPGASLAADEAGESVPGEEGRRRLTPGEARLASAVWAFASGLVVTGEEPNDTGADSGAASAVQATLDGAGAEQTEGHWRTAMLRGEPVAFTARSLAAASIGGRSAPFWWPPNRISDEGASTPRPPPQEGAEAIEAGVGGAVVPARESTGVVVWATHLRRARGIVAFVLENLALAVVIVAIIEFRAAFLLGGRVQGPLASAVRRAERLATFAKTALATVDALRAHIGAGSLAKADMDRIQRVKALRVAHERHSPQGAPRKHRRGGSGGSTAGSQPADGSVDLSGSRSGGGAGHTDAWPAGPRVASPPADADADAVAGGAVPRSRSRTAIGAGPGSGGGASSSPLQTNRGRAVSVPSASGRPSPTNGSLAAPRVLEGGSGAMTAAEAASAAAQPRYRSSRAVSVHSPRVPAEDGLGRAFADLSTVRASGSVLGLFHHAGSRAPSSRRPDAWYRRRGAGQGSAARDELMERSAQFQDCDVFEVAGAPMRLQAGQLLSGQRGLSSHSTRQSTVGDDTTDHSQPDGIYSSRVVHEDGQPVVLLGPSYSDRDAAAVAPTGHGDVMRGGTLRTPATLGPPSSDAGDGSARGELVAARVESTPGGMDALATDALKGKGGTITADQLVPELAGTQNEVDWLVLFFEAATRPAEEDDSWMYGGVAKGRKIVKQS